MNGEDYEWNISREWSQRWIRWLLHTVEDDWRNARVSRDFFDKMGERGFTRQQIGVTISSPVNQNDFLQTLSNYRASIVKTLPSYIGKRLTDDESLADELSLMLYSRDVLARALASADVSAQAHLSEVEQLDRQLLNLKDALLPLVPFYAQLRQRKPRPRSQWWYYLDEVVSSPPVEKKTSINYWLPLTPQPTP